MQVALQHWNVSFITEANIIASQSWLRAESLQIGTAANEFVIIRSVNC
jgi:hypothetical protein